MMKAAVLDNYGEIPQYKDIADPKVENDDQIIVTPIASSIKQLDKSRASGKHYTKFDSMPAVMGMDGVVQLPDGKRAFAMGDTGMMAEKAVIDKDDYIEIPKKLSSELAAALPNALMGSDLAMTSRGKIQDDDVVFINGATGLTGSTAVQMAKYHNASTVIVTGHDQDKLDDLKQVGADVTINTSGSDDEVIEEIVEAYNHHPFNIVLDYLWGSEAERIFAAFGKIKFQVPLRYVSIGSFDGGTVTLPSALLRSRDIKLMGSGFGSLPRDLIENYFSSELPDIFDYAVGGNIKLKLNTFPLEKISEAWETPRSVITSD